MISYRKECWDDFARDAEPLWALHHEEVAGEYKGYTPSPDHTRFKDLETHSQLLILTAWDGGKMIGYLVLVFCRHPHYNILVAFEDMHFLLREYRKSLRSPWFKLEAWARHEARVLGCHTISLHTKGANRAGKVLRALGYSLSHEVWTEVL